jgi:hypothetical protein
MRDIRYTGNLPLITRKVIKESANGHFQGFFDITPNDEKEGLLTEYRTLKSELHNAQGQRLQIISLTVGTLGVLLSITANAVLGSGTTLPEARLLLTIGGAIVMYTIP